MSARVLASTEGLSREQWLSLRRKGIGGSDASVICGINRHKSPLELWMDKTGQMPYQEAGETAYWGTTLESIVRAEFTKRTGIEVVTVNKLLQSKEYPFMLANIDGCCKHSDFGPVIFEAKTASAYLADEWEDSIPNAYQCQLQHYMSVAGYRGSYIAVLIGGNAFKWTFVERNPDFIAMLVRLEADFWERVENGIPPELDGSEASSEFVKKQFPKSVPQSKIELPAVASSLISQYEAARIEADRHSEIKREAENKLKQMLGEHEIGAVGNGYIRWQSISKTSLDSKLLEAERPEIYKQYTNTSSYRRFTVKAATTEKTDKTNDQLRKAG